MVTTFPYGGPLESNQCTGWGIRYRPKCEREMIKVNDPRTKLTTLVIVKGKEDIKT